MCLHPFIFHKVKRAEHHVPLGGGVEWYIFIKVCTWDCHSLNQGWELISCYYHGFGVFFNEDELAYQ